MRRKSDLVCDKEIDRRRLNKVGFQHGTEYGNLTGKWSFRGSIAPNTHSLNEAAKLCEKKHGQTAGLGKKEKGEFSTCRHLLVSRTYIRFGEISDRIVMVNKLSFTVDVQYLHTYVVPHPRFTMDGISVSTGKFFISRQFCRETW